jgi:hypothetical protein
VNAKSADQVKIPGPGPIPLPLPITFTSAHAPLLGTMPKRKRSSLSNVSHLDSSVPEHNNVALFQEQEDDDIKVVGKLVRLNSSLYVLYTDDTR